MPSLAIPPFEAEVQIEVEALARAGRRLILVDGFNVLHAAILRGREGRSTWFQREGRDRVIAKVATWSEPDDVLFVVFDGRDESWSVAWAPVRGPGLPCPLIHVVFARSADDFLVRRARRAPVPDRLVVVSADRQVRGRVESAGCPVWSPRAFVARCGPGAEESSQPPDDGDVAARPSPKITS